LFSHLKTNCINQLTQGCQSITTALFEIKPQTDQHDMVSRKTNGLQGRIEQSNAISEIFEILNHSCVINYESEFCKNIVQEIESLGWVDIEQKYFNAI
jgi:hypothetical protein